MSWEQRKNEVIGDRGEERAGRAVAGEAAFNAGRGQVAEGMATERGFAQQLSAEQQAKQIEGWQAQIVENKKMVEAFDASISEVNAQLQKGEESAAKNPGVAAINKMLAGEAMKKKSELLTQKNVLVMKNEELEGKIVSAAH